MSKQVRRLLKRLSFGISFQPLLELRSTDNNLGGSLIL
jgi:hypothetical protein